MSLTHLGRKVGTCQAAGSRLGSQRTEHMGYSRAGPHSAWEGEAPPVWWALCWVPWAMKIVGGQRQGKVAISA